MPVATSETLKRASYLCVSPEKLVKAHFLLFGGDRGMESRSSRGFRGGQGRERTVDLPIFSRKRLLIIAINDTQEPSKTM